MQGRERVSDRASCIPTTAAAAAEPPAPLDPRRPRAGLGRRVHAGEHPIESLRRVPPLQGQQGEAGRCADDTPESRVFLRRPVRLPSRLAGTLAPMASNARPAQLLRVSCQQHGWIAQASGRRVERASLRSSSDSAAVRRSHEARCGTRLCCAHIDRSLRCRPWWLSAVRGRGERRRAARADWMASRQQASEAARVPGGQRQTPTRATRAAWGR